MPRKHCVLALGLALLAVSTAQGQVVAGKMAVTQIEMW
jgi:hypothetical protein